jgi:hypothetical protein
MSSKEQRQKNNKESSKQRPSKPAAENLNAATQQQIDSGLLVQQARSGSKPLTPRDVLQLQRTVGNRAVGALLTQTKPCSVIQTKLTVGAVHDPYEQEADHVAQQVVSQIDEPRSQPTRVVQQTQTNHGSIQRFAPEDAAEEMIGKTFTLNKELKTTGYLSGITVNNLTLPKGSPVVITIWSNTDTTVNANYTSGNNVFSVTIEKSLLVPVGDTKSGLYQYHAGVANFEKNIDTTEAKISKREKELASSKQNPDTDLELQRLKYQLNGGNYPPKIMNDQALKKQLDELTQRMTPLKPALNKALIQETMYNTFDANIKKWVDTYNAKFKYNPPLDPNLVKSIILQESHMGTEGKFLEKEGVPEMTRFNISQAIDSSGEQLIIMIKEIKPDIATKWGLDQVLPAMYTAQALVAKRDKKEKLTADETKKLADIDARTLFEGDRYWNEYIRSDKRWWDAVTEFFAEKVAPTQKPRNLNYDFWIQTAIRWLFEKRKGVDSWEEAIAAYNGWNGKNANTPYQIDVLGRLDDAKKNAKDEDFIPGEDYGKKGKNYYKIK